MSFASKTFRIFVSSTFSDLKEERNALQSHVFPRLRELCAEYGCRFQAIDLRWGIREEASLDHQTMRICIDEIVRCQKTTPRPNFVILLGDRYGWRPLPAEIPGEEFERIADSIAEARDQELLEKWYRRDDNVLPPVYYLQPRRPAPAEGSSADAVKKAREAEAAEWSLTEKDLRRILAAAISSLGFSEGQRLKYESSATEQEIVAGAMQVQDAQEHVFCFFRKISGLPEETKAADFIDLDEKGKITPGARARLDALKSRLKDKLPGNIFEYDVAWTGQGVTTGHLDRFCEDVYQSLSQVILKEVARIKEIPPLDKEIDDHISFRQERAKFFIGRTEALSSIASYLKGNDPHPLAVFGDPGSGKSALLAKAIEAAGKSHPGAEIVFRFIGATPASSDIRALLENLCRQVSRHYEAEESNIPTEFKELADELPKRLALAKEGTPLMLFIDALDQLGDAHNARSLSWLPAELPSHVRLVLSSLPGETLTALERKLPSGSLVRLEPMGSGEGEELLDLWLKDGGRTLQKEQRDDILAKFRMNGLPLYLKLAFEEARRWKSYMVDRRLSPDIAGVIRDFFSRLSADTNHGSIMVSRSLGYLAASKNGLSEDELIDVLSRDGDVFRSFMERAFHEPPEKRLPVVVWSRLYFDIEPYLAETSADGTSLLTFYHPSTIGRAVRELYLSGEESDARHAGLAEYFLGQRLFIEKEGAKVPNLRKLSELPFQETYGKKWDDLYNTLTDFEFLEAKCTYIAVSTTGKGEEAGKVYGGVYELIEDYRRALEVFPSAEQGE